MIVLPAYPPRRAWLQSFGVCISLVAGLILLAFWFLLSLEVWSFAIIVVFNLSLLLLAIRVPRFFQLPYRVWNRLAYSVSKLVEWWALKSLHWILVLSTRMSSVARSDLELVRPGRDSLWKGRSPEFLYETSCSIPPERAATQSRFSALIDQWRSLDEIWPLRILPCLYILSEVRISDLKEDRQENIYTLF